MKKLGLSLSLLALVVGMTACGSKAETKKETTESKSKEEKVIKVASQTMPMTDVVEVAAKEAKKDGWTVELVQVNDNIQYNELLKNKEVDANFAQHEPFMQKFNQEKKADLVAIQKIYNAKVGFYSKNYKNMSDIPDGAKVAIPNDVSNEGRALAILNEQGLITLKDGVGFNGTLKDIEKNDKKLEFMSIDLLNLAESYNEKDVALVYNYPTYIAKIGLKPADALFLEKTVDERFAISLVAREDNKDSDKIKELKKAMTSQAVKDFLEKEHSDTLTPAF
ncbi:MetQ/NlpA family ABC transporter substrate-binding protein [Vagococcus sp.]|uniref:MetQ/NlpA family ABC transporter substrate-binding protein n=1 Tax=Vagococcus sp. TaxID=1933889 RepID=UPI002FC612F3